MRTGGTPETVVVEEELAASALAEAGNSAGFGVAAYVPQAQFLLASGLQAAFEEAYAQASDDLARHRLAQQVRRLTLPEQMGERFQAMLFARGLDVLPLDAGLLAADQGGRL